MFKIYRGLLISYSSEVSSPGLPPDGQISLAIIVNLVQLFQVFGFFSYCLRDHGADKVSTIFAYQCFLFLLGSNLQQHGFIFLLIPYGIQQHVVSHVKATGGYTSLFAGLGNFFIGTAKFSNTLAWRAFLAKKLSSLQNTEHNSMLLNNWLSSLFWQQVRREVGARPRHTWVLYLNLLSNNIIPFISGRNYRSKVYQQVIVVTICLSNK